MRLSDSLANITVAEAQEWLQLGTGERWRELVAAFNQASLRWRAGEQLSPEESHLLAVASTAKYGTMDAFVEATVEKTPGAAGEMEAVASQALDDVSEDVSRAWNRLKRASTKQLLVAHEARLHGEPPPTEPLNRFYSALDELKAVVKQHSGTPGHRAARNAERDRAIYQLQHEGKTYGEIALQLPKLNPAWKVNANQAERAAKRYRERSQTTLLQFFNMLFARKRNTG